MDGETYASQPISAARSIPRNPLLTGANNIDYHWATLDEAFPDVEPEMRPFGVNVIVQIRHPPPKTAIGMIIPPETRATIYYNEQVARVVAMGPLCFKDVVRTERGEKTVEDWAGGAWFNVGDFVWIPKYGGIRFHRPFVVERDMPDGKGGVRPLEVTEDVIFATYKAKDVIGLIPGDPRRVKTFLD